MFKILVNKKKTNNFLLFLILMLEAGLVRYRLLHKRVGGFQWTNLGLMVLLRNHTLCIQSIPSELL